MFPKRYAADRVQQLERVNRLLPHRPLILSRNLLRMIDNQHLHWSFPRLHAEARVASATADPVAPLICR